MSITSYLRNRLNRLFNNSDINQKLEQLVAQVQTLEVVMAGVGRAAEVSSINQKVEKLAENMRAMEYRAGYVDKGTQLLMGIKYRELLAKGEKQAFDDVAFRNYSQSGEDGILWYIFSTIGMQSKKAVEICAGIGKQCNSANLIVNHGWHALLVEGDATNIAIAEQFFLTHPDTCILPPRIVRDWITSENVNEIIACNGFADDVDLLSLDLDGVDYWIWKAITVITPRVVVLEVQAVWECTRSVTVPYRPDFEQQELSDGNFGYAKYAGASLPAFVKLAKQKGYRLVGGNRLGFNAFFLRDDVGLDYFKEIAPELLFSHPVVQFASAASRHLYDDLEWVEI